MEPILIVVALNALLFELAYNPYFVVAVAVTGTFVTDVVWVTCRLLSGRRPVTHVVEAHV